MSRVLLADDSPHAQRMGERILREEGYEVVSVTDGDSAMKRLADVDPDVIMVDVFLPGKNGFEISRHVKSQDRHRHVRVVMTAGMLEVFDEDEARRSGADAIIKKPFEASVVLDTIKPLVNAAREAKISGRSAPPPAPVTAPAPAPAPPPTIDIQMVEVPDRPPAPVTPPPAPMPPPPAVVIERIPEPEPVPPPAPVPVAAPHPVTFAAPRETPRPAAAAEIDPELVRAAVTVALDEAMPALIDEITSRVLAALKENR